MKLILLTKGYETIVDYEDYEWLSQWSWRAKIDRKSQTVYAIRGEYQRDSGRDNKIERSVLMHRLIMGDPKGLQIDHRDWNGLNNQRSNLRVATQSQNQHNGVIRRDN